MDPDFFPENPFDGEIFPENVGPDGRQYVWNSESQTWHIIHPSTVVYSDLTPRPLGEEDPGQENQASRADHVHSHGNLGGGDLHNLATRSDPGFLSAPHKRKLDDATPSNVAGTLVERGPTGNFSAGVIIADLEGNSSTASGFEGNRTLSVTGDVSGSVSSSFSGNVSLSLELVPGSIVNADISASASIADTKLATISATDKVSLSALNIDGASDIGSALVDADLIIVDDGGAGVNRRASVTRISDYAFGKISGDVTIASNGTAAIGSGVVVNSDISASAAISHSKLANIPAGQVLLGNASNVPTATAFSGDVTIGSTGTTAIKSSVDLTGTPTAPTASAGTNTTQIATTAFVSSALDEARQGLSYKQGCRVTTTGPITLSGTQTIDGVAVAVGERVLVKNQATASQNGVYVSAAGAWSRAADFDESVDLQNGAFVFVEEGSLNADTGWVLSTDNPITVGTTALIFVQFSGAGTYSAGNGLQLSGTQFSLATLPSANVFLGNGSNVATATALSGDVTINSSGVTAIGSGVIVNADINASAAIAGTKINPNFGSQAVTTTGTITGGSFIPSSSTVPTNGVYLPAANTLGVSTNGTGRIQIRSDGNIGVGGNGSGIATVNFQKANTGGATVYGLLVDSEVQSDVTTTANGVFSALKVQDAAFTLPSLNHFQASGNDIGASASVTSQTGFRANSSLTGATTNFGFVGALPSGTGRWNFFASGTAPNYFNGDVGIGTTDVTEKLTVSGNASISGDVQAASINSGPLAGFRNSIINGNFDIWQRGTSHTTSGYGSADRWVNGRNVSTCTMSRQAFTLGQTDVPGEPTYFCRMVVGSVAGAGNNVALFQRIEDVRTHAGQTVTVSFWAKADSIKPIAVSFTQFFGTGGSPSSPVDGIGVIKPTLTTSWQKIKMTTTLPGISGKTLGSNGDSRLTLIIWLDAGSDYDVDTDSLGQQSGTFDIAKVQVEPGPVDTPFENRPIGAELALCQRYYERGTEQQVNLYPRAVTSYSTNCSHVYTFLVEKRAVPTIIGASFEGVTSLVQEIDTRAYRFGGVANDAVIGAAIQSGGFGIDSEL